MENIEMSLMSEKDAEISRARTEVTGLLNRAMELSKNIRDSESYAAAAEALVTIKKWRKAWADWNKPAKQKVDDLKKELLARERQMDEPAERAQRTYLEPAMNAYFQDVERKRKIEEDRINAELRKKADDEALARAQELAAAGDVKGATDSITNAPPPPIATMPKAAPKVAGLTPQDKYFAEVVDLTALVAAVASGKMPLAAIRADDVFLNNQATRLKDQFAATYPDSGVVCKKRTVFAAR